MPSCVLWERTSTSPHGRFARADWSAAFAAVNGNVTPDPINLTGQDFDERIGTRRGGDKAAGNAACYPGGRSGRPSYASVFEAVWVAQRWPELCDALSGPANP